MRFEEGQFRILDDSVDLADLAVGADGTVWALDSTGLHRSGGGLMPWSGWWPEAGPISGLAGGETIGWGD